MNKITKNNEAEVVLPEVALTDSSSWEMPFLGAVIKDASILDDTGVLPSHLLYNSHRLILRAVRDLIDRGIPVDIFTLGEHLERQGNLLKIGGIPALAELVECSVTPKNAMHHASIIRRFAKDREMARVGEALSGVLAANGDSAEKFAQAEELLHSIQDDTSDILLNSVESVLVQAIEQIEVNFDGKDDEPNMPFGFTELDEATYGAHPGDLIIVAGRPSMGKTAFALNIVENFARKDKRGLLCSLEMSAKQLVLRMISSAGRLDAQALRSGKIQDDDWGKITVASGKIHSMKLWIDETNSASPSDIRSAARKAKRAMGGIDYIVIDYLQLMSAGTGRKNDSKTNEVAEISKGLKNIAREFGCPVIALSQLNRELEKRANKRPIMSDLRDSGAVEQDADLILFLYRDEVYNPDTSDKNVAEIIIGKQRNGPVGTCRVEFRKDISKYQDFPCNKNY